MEEYTNRFLASEVPPAAADKVGFHVIPVPYEATVSYMGGTAHGPDAILDASDQLELYDGQGYPGRLGIFTQRPVDCGGPAEEVFGRIRNAVLCALDCGAFPVVLGGEHSLTYGELLAFRERCGDFGVIQFDAHADLRDAYDGTKWSHACAMRRAAGDLRLPLAQIGNRIFCEEELLARQELGVLAWDARTLHRKGISAVQLPPSFPRNIFVTFDVDGLDPSVIAETGTPVPGGLGWHQTLDLLEQVTAGRRLIGADVVELAPRDGFIASDFAAASLAYFLMGLALRRQ